MLEKNIIKEIMRKGKYIYSTYMYSLKNNAHMSEPGHCIRLKVNCTHF